MSGKRFKLVPEMEGRVARWYARQRGTASQIEAWRKQASELTDGLPNGATVLEVAPGPGYLASEIARLGRFKVIGLDVSRTFVDIASAHARENGVDVEFRHGDVARMPFESGCFDLIICQAAFKNFAEPLRALDEMHRVLRAGGTAIIEDLNRDASNAEIDQGVRGQRLSRFNACPSNTGPFAEPLPRPVMMWTTAPGLRRRQFARNVRTRAAASLAESPWRSSSASTGASSSGSLASKTGWRPRPRLPIPGHQLLELLQQLHHRPRIPFAVIEQGLPHAVVLVARDLPRDEQQPGDLHARHAPVHDHEVVVRQLRHERREDLLQTVAPIEAGVVHTLSHHRMKVEELRLERG